MSAARAQAARPDLAGAVLEPGDVVRITVWRRPELSGDYVVAPDGSITHPLYREVKVAGVPLAEVEPRIRAMLDKYESQPSLVVSPLLRVFAGGELRQPNTFTVPPGTTVSQLVALAGGPTDRARLDRVQLARGEDLRPLDLTRPGTGGAALPVRSGDQIIVPRRRNWVTEVLAPTSSVVAAVGVIANLVIQSRK